MAEHERRQSHEQYSFEVKRPCIRRPVGVKKCALQGRARNSSGAGEGFHPVFSRFLAKPAYATAGSRGKGKETLKRPTRVVLGCRDWR